MESVSFDILSRKTYQRLDTWLNAIFLNVLKKDLKF